MNFLGIHLSVWGIWIIGFFCGFLFTSFLIGWYEKEKVAYIKYLESCNDKLVRDLVIAQRKLLPESYAQQQISSMTAPSQPPEFGA